MRQFIQLIFAFSVILTVFSCSNELQVAEEYKNIPVVYGLLSNKDTAHYVRVEKLFINNNQSAYDIAKIVDSIYYKDGEISVEITDRNLRTWKLHKVDGTLEGYPRKTGIFANVPNYLYKIKADSLVLIGGEKIKLSIKDKNDKELASAETFVTKSPNPLSAPPLPNDFRFEYKTEAATSNVSWGFDDNSATVFSLSLIINYLESDPANPTQFLPKQLEWVIEDFHIPTTKGSTTLKIVNVDFYRFLRDNLAKTNVIRQFKNIDLKIQAGNSDLNKFIEADNVNIGITSSEFIPNYTNVKNGLGVFASRSKLEKLAIPISALTLDSLKNGQYTKDLNFK